MSEATPWEYENVHQRPERSAYGVVKDAKGKVLFDTINADVAEIHTEHDGEGGVHRWCEEARQNLTLAAAAPELLAACERLVKSLSVSPSGYLCACTYNTSVDDFNAVLAAIKKARGEA